MSPLWVYLVQVLLIVHVLKTGRSRYWILMLLFLPLIGGLAYVLLEILPDLGGGIRGQRARRQLGRALNPGGHVRKLREAWERTPNADNARHYARALLEAGKNEEAAAVVDQGLSGLFQTEPNLMLLKGRILFEQDAPAEAVSVLDELQKENPEFRSPEGHLLLARALEASGESERALEEYRSVSAYFPGVEARFRMANALERAGRKDEAHEELTRIVEDARLAPAHFRKAQATWLRRARAALRD